MHSELIRYDGLNDLFHAKPVIFHNAKFDLQILRENGILKELDDIDLHDTMLLSFILNENRASHGLKALSAEILKKEDVVKYDDVGKSQFKSMTFFSWENAEEEFAKIVAEWEDKMGSYCMDDLKIRTYFSRNLTSR